MSTLGGVVTTVVIDDDDDDSCRSVSLDISSDEESLDDKEGVKDVVHAQKTQQSQLPGGTTSGLSNNWSVAVDRLLGPGGRLGGFRSGAKSSPEPPRQFDPDRDDYSSDEMNEFDENGWAHIHQAAFRGFVKSVERFIKADEEQLELETADDLHSTPLLLAVMSGSLDTVKCLVELGAKVTVCNTQNHGVVELCAFKQFIPLLEYFIELNHEKLPVWKNLVRFLISDADEECEAAAHCLKTLTAPIEDGVNPNCKAVFDSGIIPNIIKVIRGNISDDAKIATLQLLLNLIPGDEVKEQVTSGGGVTALVRLLRGNNSRLVQLTAETIKEMAVVGKYAEQAAREGAMSSLIKAMGSITDPECLTEVCYALGNIVDGNEAHQQAVGTQFGAIQSIVALFQDQTHKSMLMSLTECIGKVAQVNESNQNAFVNDGVTTHIVNLVRSKNRDIQLSAVACIHRLAENNPQTQRSIMDEGIILPLMQLLKKSRQQDVQEKTAAALWTLAGDNMDEKRNMAATMGVQLLIEFMSSLSEDLHLIGSEAMGVLAQGPLNKQDEIANANGVHPCVRLLRADKEHIVLSIIKTMRGLCVGVGYVPHHRNQTTIAQSRGIKFLVALMIHSRNELIQVEAAHTLACVTLGNSESTQEILENPDFSYVRVLKMMYSPEPGVRLMAGSALAAFAYNSLGNQREIAEQGGVRFSCFVPFLESPDEFQRCNAAFQVVVLARIIPDEEQAISSAAGIKLLSDLLHGSTSHDMQALACDCIARLTHTRAGIPAAFVSVDCVNNMCDLLQSPAEQVRGCAAIALGYLSYNHTANRQLLNKCRSDPVLMRVLRYYTQRSKISTDFIEGWKHYKQVGLPPIEDGRLNLVGRKTMEYKDFSGRPLTITSLDDTTGGGSTNTHTSPSVLNNPKLHDEDKSHVTTGRSSRVSRLSNQSVTPRPGRVSVTSLRSRRESMLSTASAEV